MAGTIVYVDNEQDLPEGLARELGRLGFRLHYTADLGEALALARDGIARLVMLEVLMDGGWRLIQRIRELERPNDQIPIVVLTQGERTPKLYGRAVELGVDDFLARPVLRSEVLSAILGCVEDPDAGPPVDPLLAGPRDAATGVASGSLEDFCLPELMLHLRDHGATGVLYLQNFEDLVVQLRNGSPIGVASSRSDETFSDFLMRTKRISGREHEALLERVHSTGESEPAAAVAIGAMSRDHVREALADRAAEPLLEAFAWTAGSWRFERGRKLRSGHALERGATNVLVQGVLQWTSSRAVRAMLDRRGAQYLSKVERPSCAFADLSPPPCDPDVIARWDGDETVAEVLESRAIGERELYALLVGGLVEAREQPLLELRQIAEPTPPTRVEPDRPRRAPPSTRREPTETPRADAPDAAPGERSRSDDARASAPSPASTHAAALAAEPTAAEPRAAESDAGRAKDAERHFFEGEKHLAARRYDRAAESFGMCAHLDPSQGDYHAHLGYALHLQHPESEVVRREALEHIAKGIKLASDHWQPLLYLARVFVAADELQNARKVLRSGLAKHPGCVPLKEELQRLAQHRRTAPNDGLVDRLRRWWGK